MKYAVYGTLRPGNVNHKNILKDRPGVSLLKETRIYGYEMYNVGTFPAIKKSNKNKYIVVNIFDIDNKKIEEKIDQLEGINSKPPLYNKIKINDMFIYVWNRSVKNLKEIIPGDWNSHIKNLKKW